MFAVLALIPSLPFFNPTTKATDKYWKTLQLPLIASFHTAAAIWQNMEKNGGITGD